MATKKTIKATHSYDKEADVLYVSFGDDEPTYVDNIDDVLLIEVGCFSGLPKGFRILGARENKVQVSMVFVQQIKNRVHSLMENQRRVIKQQEPIFTNFCNTLPKIFATAQQGKTAYNCATPR